MSSLGFKTSVFKSYVLTNMGTTFTPFVIYLQVKSLWKNGSLCFKVSKHLTQGPQNACEHGSEASGTLQFNLFMLRLSVSDQLSLAHALTYTGLLYKLFPGWLNQKSHEQKPQLFPFTGEVRWECGWQPRVLCD